MRLRFHFLSWEKFQLVYVLVGKAWERRKFQSSGEEDSDEACPEILTRSSLLLVHIIHHASSGCAPVHRWGRVHAGMGMNLVRSTDSPSIDRWKNEIHAYIGRYMWLGNRFLTGISFLR